MAMVGLAKVTVSVSEAEQTPVPAVQETLGFVLLTLAGGVIEAVLVTKGCAWARVA